MRLRPPLLLAGLALLGIPWLGYQGMRLLDLALYRYQGQVLHAMASSAAAGMARRLAADPVAQRSLRPATRGTQLYSRWLAADPIVDGYLDDGWAPQSPQSFADPADSRRRLKVWLGRRDAQLFLFARVFDSHFQAHDPASGLLASGDHLVLQSAASDGKVRHYVIRSGAPGEVVAFYRATGAVFLAESRIKGVWQESPGGYQVELQMPRSLMGESLSVAAVMASGAGGTLTVGSAGSGQLPLPLLAQVPEWTPWLEDYGAADTRVYILSRDGWLLASAGRLSASEHPVFGLHALWRRVGLLFTGGTRDPQWLGRDSAESGQAPEVALALSGRPGLRWYRNGSQRIARVVAPLQIWPGEPAAALVVERDDGRIVSIAESARVHLLPLTLLVWLLSGLFLGGYVYRVSMRIQRLGKAAVLAVDRSGRLRSELPDTSATDAIGELARSYSQLLARLDDYHHYQRTLSSKLSHELRTPLAVIRTSLDNLQSQVDAGSSAATYMLRAQDGVERLAAILAKMSFASRVEESIAQSRCEYLSLSHLLGELVAAYRQLYPQRTLNLHIEAADDVLFGSAELLVQMLDKLVENAVDFSVVDSAIDISLQRGLEGLALSVSNRGPLLPEHMEEQLFDALVSVRAAGVARQGVHLGLGLYIVRLIAGFHGATVAARNLEDGSGVSVTVSFTQMPAAPADGAYGDPAASTQSKL